MRWVERGSKTFNGAFVATLILGIGLIDWWSGPDLSLTLFYLVPIAIASWSLRTTTAVAVCAFASATSLGADIVSGQTFASVFLPLWNNWARLGIFVLVVTLLSTMHRLLDQEKEVSRTDFLTGVSNKRAFEEFATRELERGRRNPRPLSVLYVDVDDFKAINDRCGHGVGDEVLRMLARGLRHNTRATDFVARVGGDEFAILMPETNDGGAKALMSTLSSRVQAQPAGVDFPVTFSMGAVTFESPPKNVDRMIGAADEQMYRAKSERSKGNGARHSILS